MQFVYCIRWVNVTKNPFKALYLILTKIFLININTIKSKILRSKGEMFLYIIPNKWAPKVDQTIWTSFYSWLQRNTMKVDFSNILCCLSTDRLWRTVACQWSIVPGPNWRKRPSVRWLERTPGCCRTWWPPTRSTTANRVNCRAWKLSLPHSAS